MLWYVTVIGPCFGSDQLALGWLATAIGFVVLWALKSIENRMVTEHQTKLMLAIGDPGPAEDEIRARLRAGAIEVVLVNLVVGQNGREYTFRARETEKPSLDVIPHVIEELAKLPGVPQTLKRVAVAGVKADIAESRNAHAARIASLDVGHRAASLLRCRQSG
jgi:hypothetical protein